MILNEIRWIVENEWKKTGEIRKEVTLDDFIIMPNHLHGIVIIDYVAHHVGAHGRAPLHRNPGSLGSIIAGFKSSTTTQINIYRGTPGVPVWQRGYDDRIIRDEK
jgi:hypothetical protein